jgi:hypothetical protein
MRLEKTLTLDELRPRQEKSRQEAEARRGRGESDED